MRAGDVRYAARSINYTDTARVPRQSTKYVDHDQHLNFSNCSTTVRAGHGRPGCRRPTASSTRCARRRSRTWASPASITHRATAAGISRGHPRPGQNAGPDRRDRRAHRVARGRRCSSRAPRRRPSTPCATSCRTPTYHAEARAITLAQGEIPRGHGTILIACAGTSDLPVAEEAAVTAELMGNTVDRLYDVGVAGHPSPAQRTRPHCARPRHHRRGRHGRRAAERRRRAGQRAGDRRADQRRLRRELRRHRGAARHAQQLRERRRAW